MQLLHIVTDFRHRRGTANALALLAVLAAPFLVAGCGGSHSNQGVATVTTTSTSTGQSSTQAAGARPALSAGTSASTPGDSSQEIEIAGTLKFSRCMRANGVPNFPDPNSQGSIQFNTSEINPNTPQFENAQQKCAKYAGGTTAPSPAQRAQTLARALQFSKCMRSHGAPNFPDPPASGGASSKLAGTGPAPAGLDPNSPIFQHAMKACTPLLPGSAENTPTHT